MDPQELSKRLLEIARATPGTTAPERVCWLDGEECPYGNPEGQFLKRPLAFCKPNNPQGYGTNGCLKLNEHSDELEGLLSKSLRDEMREGLSEKVRQAITKVSDELSAIAELAESDQIQKVLKLAAALIKGGEEGLVDRDIVLLEDLEDLE